MPIVGLMIAIIFAVLAREYWLFHSVPGKSDAAQARGEGDAARQILENLLAQPALFGARSHAGIHHRLAWVYLDQRRPHEAAEQARKSVVPGIHPGLEAMHRLRLADCLEACGDIAEAASEREFARRLAEEGPESVVHLMARGKALRREGRYAEAIPLYDRAIALAGRMPSSVRAHLMVSQALTCWEAGRVQDAVRWADSALQLDPKLVHRTTACSVSALALGSLGRLDDAEERWVLALEAATRAGSRAKAARFLASLAEIQRRRGNLVAAVETCERAAAMSLESRRMARFVEYECFMTWGRFSDAREMLDQGARAQGFTVPASERRINALTALNFALIDAEEGRPQEALGRLDAVGDILGKDEKVGIGYHAMRAWVEALLGMRVESEHSARTAASFAQNMPDDRAAMLRYHTYLGRASLQAGEIASARNHFEACLKLGPDPAEMPRAHYFLAECRRVSDDLAGAGIEWEAAINTGLDTLYVSLARGRLKEYPAGEPDRPDRQRSMPDADSSFR